MTNTPSGRKLGREPSLFFAEVGLADKTVICEGEGATVILLLTFIQRLHQIENLLPHPFRHRVFV